VFSHDSVLCLADQQGSSSAAAARRSGKVYKFVMLTKNEMLRSQDFAGRGGGALHVLGDSSLPPVWA